MRYITTLLLVLLPLSCLAGGVEEMLGALLVGKLAHDSPEAGRILQQVIQQRPRNRNGVREYHLPQQTLPVVERADDWIQRGKSLGEQGQWNESLICFNAPSGWNRSTRKPTTVLALPTPTLVT
jgi:hypothetical protein